MTPGGAPEAAPPAWPDGDRPPRYGSARPDEHGGCGYAGEHDGCGSARPDERDGCGYAGGRASTAGSKLARKGAVTVATCPASHLRTRR
ncbi:hypothetical protein Aros01_02140 [Streptosporangium roseum]|uniref:Uncharacterized protein n=1 Tax=Streptosporangium roseum (strain ATCC 12428 / DSM 43021 / JCM 3005 / KCTC 9067 / NCIMB 10171 / NRRL 2505 / NI 9100) TaxID=479432 RepID=D2B323_STRRD|nr:hypothetical protein Sros_2527 [Streptosporangium roseum DSM 43021]